MHWNKYFVLLMAATTAITYLTGLLIAKANNIDDAEKSKRLKKFWLIVSFSSSIFILFIFKYLNFFCKSIVRVSSLFNISIAYKPFDLLVPVGISFYTFKALSYTMDVYRNDVKVEKNIFRYALYVSFFPQLLAGPIQKSKDMIYQFYERHSFDYDRVKNGLLLMLWGYFQKVFVADRLAILVDRVFDNPANFKGFQIIIAAVFYAFQIYCDFNSYSDIAIGASEVMGFKTFKNFMRPYFSKSIKEFWGRWHISLSSWFKDYLYIPLGGNRRGKFRTYCNIMIVFLICGLWHGAAVNFIIWGGLHGIYQVIGRMLKPAKTKIIDKLKIKTDVFSFRLLNVIVTFILVDFAWIFFRANKFSDSVILIKNMFYFNPWIFYDGSIFKQLLNSKDFFMAAFGIGTVFIVDLIQRKQSLRLLISKQNIVFRWAIYLAAVIIIFTFGIYGPGFNAQQFIYMQF
jgi:alginate O-acetyltransferase complex protein AlgI